MRAYICDNCKEPIEIAYVQTVREFSINSDNKRIFKKRRKIHLCSKCWRGLKKIAREDEV